MVGRISLAQSLQPKPSDHGLGLGALDRGEEPRAQPLSPDPGSQPLSMAGVGEQDLPPQTGIMSQTRITGGGLQGQQPSPALRHTGLDAETHCHRWRN